MPLPIELIALDHIGIAVIDLEEEIKRFKSDFNADLVAREVVADQKTSLAFLKLPNTKIELLSPIDSDGPITKFLNKRGPGLHHLCYQVSDIHQALSDLALAGYRLIDQTPRKGALASLIAFIHPASCAGVLTEICQLPS